MSKIAQECPRGIKMSKSGLIGRLWPNGEVSFHYPKKFNPPPPKKAVEREQFTLRDSLIRTYGLVGALEALLLLGLLNICNFDKPKNQRARYGLKGITSKGKRVVRNACYLLESEHGTHNLTFATVTLPSLPEYQMSLIHENWHRLVDFYRREIRRKLVSRGLPGEIVGVTEIQMKRFANSGEPVLHCHFVWVGRKRGGDWAVKPSEHDDIWVRALNKVFPGCTDTATAAAQLKQVEEGAESYLSKYMSKGVESIKQVIDAGFEWWLPKQWWNCSRSLAGRVKRKVREFEKGTRWLLEMGNSGGNSIYTYFTAIEREGRHGDLIVVGYYGKLNPVMNELFRELLPDLRSPE